MGVLAAKRLAAIAWPFAARKHTLILLIALAWGAHVDISAIRIGDTMSSTSAAFTAFVTICSEPGAGKPRL